MSFAGIILSIVILSILIIVHEFGHYILARKNGIFVKEFSVGFGPRIVTHMAKNGTRFSLKAIPFGGSCIMMGAMEDEEYFEDKPDLNEFDDDDDEDDDVPYSLYRRIEEEDREELKKHGKEEAFESKSIWARMSVILAGPVFNFLLAFVLAIIIIGTTGYDPALVTGVTEGSAAYEAGLREGDLITKYNGESINFGREIYMEDFLHPITSQDDIIEVTYVRDGVKNKIRIEPSKVESYMIGITYYSNDSPAEIGEVYEGGAMANAGLEGGDIITAINGTAISTGQELGEYFDANPVTSEPLTITYTRRGGDPQTAVAEPVMTESYDAGFTYNLANVKTGALGTLRYSFAEIKYQIVSVFKSIAFLISGRGSLDMVSGPVGIVQIVGDTYDASKTAGFGTTLINMLFLMLMLSANLGVINLLPFPAIDGGKFILLVIEAIRGKPIKRKYEGLINMIGAVIVMVFAVVVLINDVGKFF